MEVTTIRRDPPDVQSSAPVAVPNPSRPAQRFNPSPWDVAKTMLDTVSFFAGQVLCFKWDMTSYSSFKWIYSKWDVILFYFFLAFFRVLFYLFWGGEIANHRLQV